MVEGLEVTIKYRGAKHDQVAAPATVSSEFAILKKDLAHLRVHSPSQKNVRRVDGSFILHWPSAGTSPKVAGLVDSLHTRWSKLCSDDPEALKLREFLSIDSITMVQDGVLIRSTTSAVEQQGALPGTLAERSGESSPETAQQPTTTPVPMPSLPVKPPVIPPPRVPPTAPRFDRQQPPHLPVKRKMSNAEDFLSQTRQKLDTPEVPTTAPDQPANTEPQPTQPPTSPKTDRDQPPQPASPGDATKASLKLMQDGATASTPSVQVQKLTTPKPPEAQATHPLPSREPGEMTPNRIPTLNSGPGPNPTTRPPPNPHTLSPHGRPASPYSNSSSNGDIYGPRRRDRDVNRLTRELWDTRRQLTALQAREQSVMDDLERLGVRPDGASGDRVSRDELLRLESELKTEKARRVRAERLLSDVERECKAPFVVPALFQAFLSISELAN